jgi:ABC-type Zn uptake system ZnuABC Zn-binding protein ZnuA/ABC-type Mn2+/Zn2+ transport system permease subunit
MFEPFALPYVQRGLIEVLLLALGAGVLGTWIVLRGLAFHAHAVATATFPGLVLADGLGFAAPIGALGAAALFTLGVAAALSRRDDEHGPAVALVLVGCLAAGVILASDVFGSAANVETLLFGSLLLVDTGDIAMAAGAAALALAGTLLLGRRWLARGFDPASARSLGVRSGWPEAALLALVAIVAVSALSAVGALLATALLVVPAATTRLLVDRLLPWQVATVGLAAVEGVVGLWLSVQTDAPPGATIAVVSGAGFALAAALRWVRARRLAPAVAALGALLLAGCGGGGATGGDGVRVVASTPVVADIARELGGDRVAVTQLLQANSDPHDYEPRPSDVRKVAGAQVVLESGFGLDGWVHDVVEQSGGDPRVVDLSATLPQRLPGDEGQTGEEHTQDHGDVDPHWWHDPRNVVEATGEVAAALAKADPGGKAAYERDAAAYVAKVRALDRGVGRCLARVPASDRKLVTDHDAFGYFAHRYGIEVVGAVIPAQTTQAQASAGDVARLTRTIRAQGVKAIFPETSVNERLARAIAGQTGATVGDQLYADTLGPEGSAGATLLAAEAHNADAMVRGLTGGRERCAIGRSVT